MQEFEGMAVLYDEAGMSEAIWREETARLQRALFEGFGAHGVPVDEFDDLGELVADRSN